MQRFEGVLTFLPLLLEEKKEQKIREDVQYIRCTAAQSRGLPSYGRILRYNYICLPYGYHI